MSLPVSKMRCILPLIVNLLAWLAMPLARSAATEAFLLDAGTGCEHSVVVSGSGTHALAVTTRTEHRAYQKAPPESLGFAYLGLKRGRPVLLGTQSPDSFPPLKGKEIESHTWQALDWNPGCDLADGRELLAVAGTSGRYNGRNSKPRPCVEFFVWDRKNGKVGPRLKRLEKQDSTPFLSAGRKTNINALVLASNGDVYASVLGLNVFSRFNAVCENVPVDPEAKRHQTNSIYLWRPGMTCWTRVASGIPMANGLYLAGDGRTLCANSFWKSAVIQFARNQATGLLSQPETCYLPARNNPDNLSRLDDSRASAMATPRFQSGAALVLGGILGTTLGIHPPAAIWEIDTKEQTLRPKIVGSVPAKHGVFSDATRFGDWWLCGKMLDEGIYCLPATSDR